MIDEKFIFSGAARTKVLSLIVVGVVLLLLGIWRISSPSYNSHGHADHGDGHGTENVHHEAKTGEHGDHAEHATADHDEHNAHKPVWVLRILKNLWHNNVFFAGIAVIGLFFVAFNYVAWAGWGVVVKRIAEAFGYWLPIAAVLMIVIFALGSHDLFHWAHEGISEKTINGQPNPHYDEIIAGKTGYLNMGFYWIRLIAYFALWILVWFVLRTNSLKEDLEGGVKLHDKNVIWSAFFLFVFGVTSSTSAWDWVMSIDTHFFSTMFGWYVFASWFVTGLAVITLFVLYLKDAGYLKVVNHSHLHDLGKFVFAFSIFWTYVWFAQFLLIYYANIPEESIYFVERLQSDPYTPIFFMNLIANFVFPLLILMTREAKRQAIILKIVCFVVIFGHWFDFYIMMTPPILGEHGALDFTTLLVELGMTLVYAGAFIFVVLWGLTKANLVPKNHPMLQESLHHHIY
jgi:hypothetical protein